MTTTIITKPARLLISIFFIAALLPSIALAQVAGKLTKVSGTVDILRAGTTAATPVKVNEEVSIGDIVRTKSDGSAEITFIDNSVMTLGPRSRLGIEEYLYKSEENKRVASLKLHRGKMGFSIPKPVYAAEGSKFEMHTRTAVAGVRGTGGLLFTGLIERVYVDKGIVEFRNPLGSVTVTAGNVGEVQYGRAPTVRPYSGTEFQKQQEGISAKPAEKEAAGGKAVTTETAAAPAAESAASAAAATAAPPAPAQTTASQVAVTATAPQPAVTQLTQPLPVTEGTGTVVTPKGTPVTINPSFPSPSSGSTVNINVK